MASLSKQIYTDIQNVISQTNSLSQLYENQVLIKKILDFSQNQDVYLGDSLEAIFFELKHYINIIEQSSEKLDLYTLLHGNDFKTETIIPAAIIANQENSRLRDIKPEINTSKYSLKQKIALAQKNMARLNQINENLKRFNDQSKRITDESKKFNTKEGSPLKQTRSTISEIVDQLPNQSSLDQNTKNSIINDTTNLLVSDPTIDVAVATSIAISKNVNLNNQQTESLAQYIESSPDIDTATERIQAETKSFAAFTESNSTINSNIEEIVPPPITSVKTSVFLNTIISQQLEIDPQGNHQIGSNVSPNASQISGIIKTISQNPNDPHALAIETFSRISPETLAQSLEYALKNPNSELGKFVKENYHFISQLSDYYQKVSSSQLGNDLRNESPKIHVPIQPINTLRQGLVKTQSFLNQSTKTLNKVSPYLPRRWQTFIARATSKAPIIGKTLNFITNPIGASSSWVQQQVGKRIGQWAIKKLGADTVKLAAKELTNRLLSEGTKKAVEEIVKFVSKEGLKKGLEAVLVGAGIPSGGVSLIIWAALQIATATIESTIGQVKKVLDNIWRQFGWGDEFKATDLVFPLAFGTASSLGFFGAIGFIGNAIFIASVNAATSALFIITLACLSLLFLFFITIIIAPFISTFVSLDAVPRVNINSCANLNGIFVSQRDPAWANTFCSDCSTLGSCKIGASGCGSTSMTIVLKSFGINTSVVDVWNRQHQIGGYRYTSASPYQGCSSGNNWLNIISENNLTYTGIGTNLSEADQFLANCGLILASGDMLCNGNLDCGHILVIVGHNGNQITTMDPWSGENYVHTLGSTYELGYMWAITR